MTTKAPAIEKIRGLYSVLGKLHDYLGIDKKYYSKRLAPIKGKGWKRIEEELGRNGIYSRLIDVALYIQEGMIDKYGREKEAMDLANKIFLAISDGDVYKLKAFLNEPEKL